MVRVLTILIQVNKMRIPPVMQQLIVKIPYVEILHHNEDPVGNGWGKATTISQHAGNTQNTTRIFQGSRVLTHNSHKTHSNGHRNENEGSCDVIVSLDANLTKEAIDTMICVMT